MLLLLVRIFCHLCLCLLFSFKPYLQQLYWTLSSPKLDCLLFCQDPCLTVYSPQQCSQNPFGIASESSSFFVWRVPEETWSTVKRPPFSTRITGQLGMRNQKESNDMLGPPILRRPYWACLLSHKLLSNMELTTSFQIFAPLRC